MTNSKRIHRCSVFILIALLSGCATTPRRAEAPFIPALIQNGELPAPSSCKVVTRIAYTICLDEKSHLAAWVAYRLTREGVVSEANQRKDNWHEDPEFPYLNSKVYSKSGFDKGHLAPAEDFESSKEAMDDSFYYSNSAPQPPGFNRGLWADIEKEARKLAVSHDEVLIVTGPILEPALPSLRGAALIPKKYFKSVLMVEAGRMQAASWIAPIGFEVRNPTRYTTSVDEVEAQTGLDLFARYPQQLQAEFEK